MQMNQIYSIVNTVTQEVIGDTAVVNEDLSNIVDIGNTIENLNKIDHYVKSLVNHIGKVIFVNRKYRGGAPSVLMDGWEFGSIEQKVRADLPQATENETWDLNDGQSYDPNIFYKPSVSAKFFNKRVTFEIPMSFTERQVKQSFSNATQLNSFISMLYNEVDKSMTIKMDSLIMRTINNMSAETIHDEYGTDALNSKSGVRAVNLLYLYNQKFSQTLTADKALTTPEFVRFAALQLGLYKDRLSKMSELFNVGGRPRFTTEDDLHCVMLSEFSVSADVYLQSNTFHDQYTKLVNAETVPYWQGTGTDYAFNNISKIDVVTASGDTVVAGGILAVMFDRDALGVTNKDRRVTTNYNPKAEFFTNWYKFEAGYFNDLDENFVVFFVA